MKRRNLLLLLGGTGSAALSTGTGAFSSASADRSVEVSVVEDKNAYVGYAVPRDRQISATEGDRVTLVRIRNQFPSTDQIGVVNVEFDQAADAFEDVRIDLIPRGDGDEDDDSEFDGEFEQGNGDYETLVRPEQFDDISDEGPIDPRYAFSSGRRVAVSAKLKETERDQIDVAVTIHVRGTEGSGVSASIFGHTRAFDLTVREDSDGSSERVSGVRFEPGKSGISIETNDDSGLSAAESDGDDEGFEAVAYYEDGGVVKRTEKTEVPANETVKLDYFDGDLSNGKRIVGVAIIGIGGVYDRRTTNPPNDGNGNGSENGNGNDNWSGLASTPVDLGGASFSEQLEGNDD